MILSKNGVGLIVLLLSTIGVSVSQADLITTIATIGQIISAILMTWNQVTRYDVHNFIFKK